MALPQRKQNFMEGAAVLTLAVAVTKVMGAVYKIPLGNLLDKDGMAHFYVAYNIYSLLLIVSTAGLPLALSRLVSQADAMGQVNRRRRIFRVTAGLFFLLGLVCCGIMLFFCGSAGVAAERFAGGTGHPRAGPGGMLRVYARGHPGLHPGPGGYAAHGGEPGHRIGVQAAGGPYGGVAADKTGRCS